MVNYFHTYHVRGTFLRTNGYTVFLREEIADNLSDSRVLIGRCFLQKKKVPILQSFVFFAPRE
jgi:hypothetical protein